MLYFDSTHLTTTVACSMKASASLGLFHGGSHPGDKRYLQLCTGVHLPSGTKIIFTRDTGYHSSGWWKNPDYERCYHLSLSFVSPITGVPVQRDKKLSDEWIDLFFGKSKGLLWVESPHSEQGKANDVWHYRLFCDEHWQPFLPRDEVYSKKLTEVGWKSFSEIQADRKE